VSFDGRWAEPGHDPRESIEAGPGEQAVLGASLDRYRLTFELKCEGLTVAQLATRAVPPSALSLLGLVRHLARVEHHWTRRVLQGRAELPRLYRTGEEDVEFTGAVADDDVAAEAWATWRGEVAHAREVYDRLDLSAPVLMVERRAEAREVVVHLIEEYARHAGHADLLRECLDGRTGE